MPSIFSPMFCKSGKKWSVVSPDLKVSQEKIQPFPDQKENLDEIPLFQVHKVRSEEHTSELQSLTNLVCRLLLEKKNGERLSLGPASNKKPVVNVSHTV